MVFSLLKRPISLLDGTTARITLTIYFLQSMSTAIRNGAKQVKVLIQLPYKTKVKFGVQVNTIVF